MTYTNRKPPEPFLGINIDHVATVRQARCGVEPSVVAAAQAAVAGGADSITVHLREDRRHIQDRDVFALRKALKVRLNLEMAATPEMVRIAKILRPDSVCLVPEKRQELTTEGGLDIRRQGVRLRKVCQKIKAKGITVNFFVDPDPIQVRASRDAGADGVELHTGHYAQAMLGTKMQQDELKKIQIASVFALQVGLMLNAGHGLNYENVQSVAGIFHMNELNIGFSIVSRALFVGMEQAVRDMKSLIMGGNHLRHRRVHR